MGGWPGCAIIRICRAGAIASRRSHHGLADRRAAPVEMQRLAGSHAPGAGGNQKIGESTSRQT
jgi:hypothetical protein